MNPRRRARVLQRPLVVPPAPERRAPISADAIRAAYGAHQGHEHGGRRGLGCRTCRRYLEALVEARARERAQS